MQTVFKEVWFDVYCKSCDHLNKSEEEEPCAECLEHPANEYTHKPFCWKGDYKAVFPKKEDWKE